jgi:hypothetical protein
MSIKEHSPLYKAGESATICFEVYPRKSIYRDSIQGHECHLGPIDNGSINERVV